MYNFESMVMRRLMLLTRSLENRTLLRALAALGNAASSLSADAVAKAPPRRLVLANESFFDNENSGFGTGADCLEGPDDECSMKLGREVDLLTSIF
jgi:hypothetical protein